MATLSHGIVPDQILVASWGYGQTNVDFFQVTKVTRCTVEIRKLEKRIAYVEIDGSAVRVVPVFGSFVEDPIRRRPHASKYDGGAFLQVNSYTFARLWDLLPAYATHPAWGH